MPSTTRSSPDGTPHANARDVPASAKGRSLGTSGPDVANLGLVRPPLVYLGSIALGLVLHLLWPARLVPPPAHPPPRSPPPRPPPPPLPSSLFFPLFFFFRPFLFLG